MRDASLHALEDDGLTAPAVGLWTEQKYRLLQLYAELFATSMKGKWRRVYLDLYAGAGRSTIRSTSRIVSGSPMLALGIPNPFDHYILCEREPQLMDALMHRVKSDHPDADVMFVTGDANESTSEIRELIPRHGSGEPDEGS